MYNYNTILCICTHITLKCGYWWTTAKTVTPKQLENAGHDRIDHQWPSWTPLKQCNECTFDDARLNCSTVLNRIKAEATLWAGQGH
jgi:hypothetical protein